MNKVLLSLDFGQRELPKPLMEGGRGISHWFSTV
jgi:hypothetical protein